MKIPIVVVDLIGRQIEVEISPESSRVLLATGTFGAFVFVRTDERTALGRRIFRQLDPTPELAKAD